MFSLFFFKPDDCLYQSVEKRLLDDYVKLSSMLEKKKYEVWKTSVAKLILIFEFYEWKKIEESKSKEDKIKSQKFGNVAHRM